MKSERWFCLVLVVVAFQYSFANTYYVSISGNDLAGDGSGVNPWRTLKYAVTKVSANQGHTIQIGAGTFVESGLIEVPLGVSVVGAGVDVTIFKAASSFYYHPADPGYATNKFLISLTGFNPANGNQALRNFTIDGDSKQLHGGVFVHYRNNVVIDQIKVVGTNFTGIWLWDVKDSQLTNTQLINCSWGSTGYCVGALNLGNLERVEIAQLNVDENTGYGIKAIGPDGYNDFTNLKIHDSHISVTPFGLWNNGSAPNIAIELWMSTLINCEIYNTYVDNTISLVNSAIPSTGVQTIRVHDNLFDMQTRANGAGYGLELTIHDAEIDHNYFLEGNYGIANWDNPMQNWDIHHNTFYALTSIYPGEVVRSQWSGLHNVKLYNNTIEFTGTKTMNVVGLYGGSSDNIDIKNNLVINSNTGYNYYPNQLLHTEPGATVSNLTVLNNSTTNLSPGSVITSLINLLNPLIKLNVLTNPAVNRTGNRPAPYYIPAAGSSLIDAGVSLGFPYTGAAPDIGSYESGATANVLPQVSLTSPNNNASFTTGATIPINANATDSDGSIAKVEFFQGTTKLGEDLTSPYSFAWATVPAGNYSLTAKATDNAGALTISSAIAISVNNANVAPIVSIISPGNSASFTAGATIAINANATDSDGSIAKVEFFQGTTKLGEGLTSPYSFAWATVPAGNYSLTAKATDNLSAVTTSTAITITVSSANVAPTVSITSPSNNASYTAGSTITISSNAADSDGTIARVEFFIGTTKIGEDLTSPYSFAWTGALAGTYSLTAKATDNLGATATSSAVTITVAGANISPSVSITSPASNASFTTGSTVTINANATDPDGTITKVEFFQGTTKLGEDLASSYSFAWANVPAGNYSLTAKATDNLGAVTTSTAIAITVSNSNIAPVVNITSPSNNASFATGSTLTINANATDSDGTIAKVQFFSGATKLGEDLTSPYSFVWASLPAGNYTLTVKATDSSGAVATSAAVVITVANANVAPVVTITSPLTNSSFATGSKITIRASATDSDGTISKVEFFRGATKLGQKLSSPYSFIWNNVPAGNYVLTTRATDNGGAVTTSAPVTVKVGNASPTVSIASPANNATFVAGATVTLSANATETGGTISKVEFFQGSVKLGEVLSSPYNFVWSNVPGGNYTLTAKATDLVGVATTSAAIAIIVNTPNASPIVNVTNPANNDGFTAGSTIAINANASDSDGTISKVEFFQGTVKLGEAITGPYSFAWLNVPAGNFSLTAKATDNAGAIAVSTAVTIVVAEPATTFQLGLVASDAVLSGGMTLTPDPAASSGNYFSMPAGNGSNYYIPAPASATFYFQLSKADTYFVWGRVKSTADNQGYYIYDGKGHWSNWQAGINEQWTWVKLSDSSTGLVSSFGFSQGLNVLQMGWNDENVQIDRILVTNSAALIPTDPSIASQITVFPNPTVDTFTIQFTSPVAQQAEISMYNQDGALIVQTVVTLLAGSNSIILGTDNIYSGTYVLVFAPMTSGQPATTRVVINR